MGVEEEGADEKGWVPEAKRVRLSHIVMDAQARRVRLQCSPSGEVFEEKVVRKTSFGVEVLVVALVVDKDTCKA